MSRKILIAGFEGEKNSSKILLDKIPPLVRVDELYLTNDFDISVEQLIERLKKHNYDSVFLFGSKPLAKKLYIETTGKNGRRKFHTNDDYSDIKAHLKSENHGVEVSTDAGTYLCNNLYYHGLKHVEENQLDTEMLFIHLPSLQNIPDFDDLAEDIEDYLVELSKRSQNEH
ncbi:MAG: hypothetical protein LBG64_01680 [Pseudomonadales bacterium]|jgi:pyroglutamyl-peptidase|nr:hypothetical protein [Pseudomonadales bacterium]